MPRHMIEQKSMAFLQLLKLKKRIESVDKPLFNDKEGLKLLKDLCCEEYYTNISIEAKSKFHCLAAASALIKFILFNSDFRLHLNTIRAIYEGPDNTMKIDPISAKNLELVTNLYSNVSLHSILDKTKTNSGSRLLRSNIIMPATDVKLINSRLDTIDDITQNHNILGNLQVKQMYSYMITLKSGT